MNKLYPIDYVTYYDKEGKLPKEVKKSMRDTTKKGFHILDFASGPIQYPEYLDYSKNFKIRHCVDFSKLAIREGLVVDFIVFNYLDSIIKG